jgi:hypothetical protein
MITHPGADGEPVPGNARVIRLAQRSKDFDEHGKVSPAAFQLSSTEERQHPPRLSVFIEDLTTPMQAAELLGRPQYKLAVFLLVDTVRAVRPTPDPPGTPGLDVQWHPIDDDRPGAAGHAGITGLNNENRLVRRSFRAKLADLADVLPLERCGDGSNA